MPKRELFVWALVIRFAVIGASPVIRWSFVVIRIVGSEFATTFIFILLSFIL